MTWQLESMSAKWVYIPVTYSSQWHERRGTVRIAVVTLDYRKFKGQRNKEDDIWSKQTQKWKGGDILGDSRVSSPLKTIVKEETEMNLGGITIQPCPRSCSRQLTAKLKSEAEKLQLIVLLNVTILLWKCSHVRILSRCPLKMMHRAGDVGTGHTTESHVDNPTKHFWYPEVAMETSKDEGNQHSYLAMTSMNHINDEQAMKTLKVQ